MEKVRLDLDKSFYHIVCVCVSRRRSRYSRLSVFNRVILYTTHS